MICFQRSFVVINLMFLLLLMYILAISDLLGRQVAHILANYAVLGRQVADILASAALLGRQVAWPLSPAALLVLQVPPILSSAALLGLQVPRFPPSSAALAAHAPARGSSYFVVIGQTESLRDYSIWNIKEPSTPLPSNAVAVTVISPWELKVFNTPV